MQTQAASNGRGVVVGRIYREDGTLVAVVSQEGLIRGQDSKPPAAKDSTAKAKL